MTSVGVAAEATRQQALLQEIRATGSARRGVAVYRANAAALAERALAAMYPTLHSLLGADDFRHLAVEHWRDHPPQRGDISEWGWELPDWIGRHTGLTAWPYLADCARLDGMRHACERAPDAELDAGSLMLLDQRDPAGLALRLRSGAAVLTSIWPVVSIWQAHQHATQAGFAAAREAIDARRAESAWVLRCGWRAQVQRVDSAQVPWLHALLAGESLAAALNVAGTGFDFAAWLAEALRENWLQGVVIRGD